MTDGQTRIMVVDDDQVMRITLKGIIEDAGYEVAGADDGYQAIESAKETRFTLILMDMQMPGISGVEACKEIRRISPRTVVVLMTGSSIEGLVTEALQENACAVVYRPVPTEQIVGIVRAALKSAFVLAVDDQAADPEALRAALAGSGYKVCVAADGDLAVSMARDGSCDIVLMSIGVPSADGVTALEAIRQADPLAKVLFIADYTLRDAVREALLAGAFTAVTKPMGPAEMLTLMNSLAGTV